MKIRGIMVDTLMLRNYKLQSNEASSRELQKKVIGAGLGRAPMGGDKLTDWWSRCLKVQLWLGVSREGDGGIRLLTTNSCSPPKTGALRLRVQVLRPGFFIFFLFLFFSLFSLVENYYLVLNFLTI